LDAGEVAYGVVTAWPDPDLVEAAGVCGFDFVFIDAEHGALDIRTCAELVRAADCGGMTSLIRVPYADPRGFYPYLDLGAHGLIFPHVRNAAEAAAVVDASLFPPKGMRGALSSSRAARYGTASTPAEYFAAANDATWIFPMIEDVEAVLALDEIAANAALNGIFVGPGDLGLSRVAGGRRDAPPVEALVDRAIEAGVRYRKVVGTVAATPEAAATLVGKGVRVIATGAGGLFTSACRSFLRAAPRQRT
jgi:4-hydroxy-2-oxoheptanedioate aldolase